MWRRLRPLSTCGRSQRGAIALLLVLGAMTVLIVLGAVAANAARQELRLSQGEATAEQVAILVEAGFSEAAKWADLNEAWPTTPFEVGSTPCDPSPPYPSYCVDAMAKRSTWGTEEAIPIRVAYRVSEAHSVGESFGWIVTDYHNTLRRVVVMRVVPNRAWCEPATESGTGPCAYGG